MCCCLGIDFDVDGIVVVEGDEAAVDGVMFEEEEKGNGDVAAGNVKEVEANVTLAVVVAGMEVVAMFIVVQLLQLLLLLVLLLLPFLLLFAG